MGHELHELRRISSRFHQAVGGVPQKGRLDMPLLLFAVQFRQFAPEFAFAFSQFFGDIDLNEDV